LIQPKGEDDMHKKLTASAATSLLLLGASGVAMAQEVPPLVVVSAQTTPDVVVNPPIVVGGPCIDAVQALRTVPLELQGTNVIQGSFLTFVMGTRGASGAILVCALEGVTPPPTPIPPAQ
jgi:hypothetical protein